MHNPFFQQFSKFVPETQSPHGDIKIQKSLIKAFSSGYFLPKQLSLFFTANYKISKFNSK
jgi:hypothetical protein